MGLFARTPTKEGLQAHRKVSVCGMRFVIRRLTPLADFDGDRMPQIFTETTRSKPQDLSVPAVAKRLREDMQAVIQAGVVDPPLAGPGKPGLNVDDMFRDPEVANKLYILILEHSLLRLKPWQIPFFFLARLLFRSAHWLRSTVRGHATSRSRVSS